MKRTLPLGTILKLDLDSDEKIMIIGRLIKDTAGDNKEWDYCGCHVPHGINDKESLKFFNHEEIRRLLFIGYQDEEELQYSIALAAYKNEHIDILNHNEILEEKPNGKYDDKA